MKRMTYMDGGKWRLRVGDTEYSGKAVDRLAAYESTELNPEEIAAILVEDGREERVKAVRCENCKYATHLHNGESLKVCGYLCGLNRQEMRSEDFCSRGKRIDEDE